MESKPVLLNSIDLLEFSRHLKRHLSESGRDGLEPFHPLGPEQLEMNEGFRERVRARWQRRTTEPEWERVWGFFEGDHIVAHLDLKASPLWSDLHRATLGMGVESPYRGKGFGRTLIHEAIDWARRRGELEYLDLRVFANNTPALKLYESCGFRENGRTIDRFRIEDRSIDDISMTLKL